MEMRPGAQSGSQAGTLAGAGKVMGRKTDPGCPNRRWACDWDPSIPFTIPCFQVTLLDFGASREFETEFTDHYIEVSLPQTPEPLKG